MMQRKLKSALRNLSEHEPAYSSYVSILLNGLVWRDFFLDFPHLRYLWVAYTNTNECWPNVSFSYRKQTGALVRVVGGWFTDTINEGSQRSLIAEEDILRQ